MKPRNKWLPFLFLNIHCFSFNNFIGFSFLEQSTSNTTNQLTGKSQDPTRSGTYTDVDIAFPDVPLIKIVNVFGGW